MSRSAGAALELTGRETEGDGEWTELAPGIAQDDYTPKPPMLTSALPPDQPPPPPALPPASRPRIILHCPWCLLLTRTMWESIRGTWQLVVQ